jgi:N utilization substance protein A
MKGSRVQAVVQELRGEKIDIVPWDPDPAKFICSGLAPAEIVRVVVDEENHSMEVVVPDDQLSLAIGKRGQNVRLASKLSGWHLDVNSESNYNRTLKEAYDSLLRIEGVGEKTAVDLYQAGYRSAADVAETPLSELLQLKGMDEEKAQRILESAAKVAAEPVPQEPPAEEEAAPADSAEAPVPDGTEAHGGEGTGDETAAAAVPDPMEGTADGKGE